MKFIKTKIKDVIIVEPHIFKDNRGYFFESYNKKEFIDNGINCNFVQDNQSMSEYGVIRGLHCQLGEYSQAKLVRVIKGKVLDVVIDIRPKSKTFGKHIAVELSEENQKQLFVPRGFLHGFSTLSKSAIFSYKCDNYYNKESEYGVLFNDSDLNIDWMIPKEKIIASEKDLCNNSFNKLKELLNDSII